MKSDYNVLKSLAVGSTLSHPHIQKYRLLSNMAPHGRELITGEKDTIAKTSEEGFSSFKIQEMIGINCRIIQNRGELDTTLCDKVCQ
jgi:hypothetical protein